MFVLKTISNKRLHTKIENEGLSVFRIQSCTLEKLKINIINKYSECSIIRHPLSQFKRCQITNCPIIESSYIAKDLSRPIIYPLKHVGLWNVGLLGIGLQAFTVFNFTKIENLVLVDFYFSHLEI